MKHVDRDPREEDRGPLTEGEATLLDPLEGEREEDARRWFPAPEDPAFFLKDSDTGR